MANKIVFNPGDESDLEELSVTFEGDSMLFKRGVPRSCPAVLAATLLKQQPEKFKAVDEPADPTKEG